MRRVTIMMAFSTVLSACAGMDRSPCADFASGFQGEYAGVVLATEAGDATFAPYSMCAFRLSGSDGFYQQVSERWQSSPYEGPIRPLYIRVAGNIRLSDNHDQSSVLRVEKVYEVSLKFSDEEAQSQSKLRANRDLRRLR